MEELRIAQDQQAATQSELETTNAKLSLTQCDLDTTNAKLSVTQSELSVTQSIVSLTTPIVSLTTPSVTEATEYLYSSKMLFMGVLNNRRQGRHRLLTCARKIEFNSKVSKKQFSYRQRL
eukprot:CAMPEP_0201113686 /NCGR_PEP_ID=MMETSP0812-20130820/77979_1 /ASSEMBLY_ACC=CAM_ASM_000668 /TAXON_ID=98059 /ORGANISM="Dinobryon sp., Strain UTEXLB2267" /LENGTH=119 /DNA_ID=CAMNT_0047377239 /DNA_START=237 /DNA_END=596 /DNA_ORIENTATION=+